MNNVMLGATAMASAIGGLFFLRFWMKTHDRLFLLFAIAFWLLSLNWLGVAVVSLRVGYDNWNEADVAYFYMIRLVAFGLILFGIIDKNRVRPAQPE
jgi:hypothetical protein